MGNNTVNQHNIKYSFDSNVGFVSKNTLKKAFSDIQSRATKNQEFFSGLTINVYGMWEESYEFKKITDGRMGFTVYPVVDNGRNIYLQTLEISSTENSLVKRFMANQSEIKETAMHELGHVFDYYFANPDKKTEDGLRQMYKLGRKYINCHKEEYARLLEMYRKTNGLSDSDVFKEAWKNDVEKEFKSKSKTKIFNKTVRLGYYSPDNTFNRDKKNRIKLEDGIDEQEIVLSDRAREEIFAQLFAYALGAEYNSKEKETIINTYPECYQIVKNYINECLGITIDEHSEQGSIDVNM